MKKKILVIGDLLIDETFHVEVNRISPEAPVPVAELLEAEGTRTAGGAGFAATWAGSQGIETTLMCAVNGVEIPGINLYPLEKIERNVIKTRFIDKTHGYHLLRVDNDKVATKPTVTPEQMLEKVQEFLKGNQMDAFILSDYNKGLFNPKYDWGKFISFLASQAICILDTKAQNIDHFMIEGNYNNFVPCLIKVNMKEVANLGRTYGNKIQDLIPYHTVTSGKEGAYIYYERPGIVPHVREAKPTVKVYSSAPDTTGCGDIFDITLALELSSLDFCPIEGEGTNEEDKNFWLRGSHKALQKAVNVASYYANIPFKEKLCSPIPTDLML
jgi:bifunctional ADP-heptose synthase (sugar kinase/adenylyltransferase)